MSFFEREYEKAVRYGNYEYQKTLLSSEIRRLNERQRTIERAKQRALQKGYDEKLVDYSVETEKQLNQKTIDTLKAVREETRERLKAEKQGKEGETLPKVKTYKALQAVERQTARALKEEAETPKPSQRTLSAKIQKGINEQIEELIQRMFFKGKYLTFNYEQLSALSQQYKWVFDILGFTLSDLFRQDVARNYSDYSSATAFEFFNQVIEREISDSPLTYEKDGVEYVDSNYEHTLNEYNQAIREIIAQFR